jgi:hypothetical protein
VGAAVGAGGWGWCDCHAGDCSGSATFGLKTQTSVPSGVCTRSFSPQSGQRWGYPAAKRDKLKATDGGKSEQISSELTQVRLIGLATKACVLNKENTTNGGVYRLFFLQSGQRWMYPAANEEN